MSTAVAKKKAARLLENKEVWLGGVKTRGVSPKGGQSLVVVKSTPIGTFKKNLINACFLIETSAVGIGLALDWTPDLVHVAYPLLGVAITGLLTIFLTKME